MKVLFLGRGELGLRILKRILEDGYDVPLILATKHTPEIGASPKDFHEMATRHGIEYDYTTRLSADRIDKLRRYEADIAVAIQWRTIIGKAAINTTKHGFLNVHCGELPRLRGNATPNWAILMNEPEAVLCVHFMISGDLDSGDILGKSRMPLASQTTIGEVYDFALREGPLLVSKALIDIEAGTATPEKQDHAKALRCYPRIPFDGEIDWKQNANTICSLVRSLSAPFDGAYTFFDGTKMRIWSCREKKPKCDFWGVPGHVVEWRKDGPISVITGQQGLVELSEVQLEDGEKEPPGGFIRSIRVRLGMNASKELYTLRAKIHDLESVVNSLKKLSAQNGKPLAQPEHSTLSQ